MSPNNTPEKTHRPRAPWRNYKARGIYLITIVVRHREALFGTLNMDVNNPAVVLSEVGKAVEHCWKQTIAINALKNRKIKLLQHIIMPDHFHGVIFVEEDMDVSVGRVIRNYKSLCTQKWRAIVTGQPTLVDQIQNGEIQAENLDDPIIDYPDPNTGQITKRPLKNLSKKQRDYYYSSLPRHLQPLFDDDYDDTILYKRGQLQNMINYVKDNPRRAIYRSVYKDLYQKIMKIEIAGRLYGAFGNLFLLKWPHKVAVWFHRHEQSPENLRLPMAHRKRYEDTELFAQERANLMEMANEGTLIVTAGISKGEQIIKKDCMEGNLRIIHIQKEPISQFWKPEKSRFDYCATGNMLILAPLDIDAMDKVNGVDSSAKYSQFHNLNTLAQEIADFYGQAYIKH
ncbi:MAG: hypothetical protein MJZ61_00705 [Bacteroidales bacterium]|nr:hypothetical protein [Bacteroidales bacterium]